MPDRHYSDDEVAEIFRAAAEGPEPGALAGGTSLGLTLPELQGIAREAGISPDAVTRAANALDRSRPAAASESFLGLPVRVERAVALERPLTDAEWELLVVRLREVFRAHGKLRTYGSLREWSNGNLRALVEPTATGSQLRISTVKGGARSSIVTGTVLAGASIAMMITSHGHLAATGPGLAAMIALGAGLIARGGFRLPSWARLRGQQMDSVIQQIQLAPVNAALHPPTSVSPTEPQS